MDDWPFQTVTQAIDGACTRFGGDREMFVCESPEVRLTARELAAETSRFARALMALGVERGDAVAIWAPGHWMWPVAQLACGRIGAVVAGINIRYRPPELAQAFAKAKPRVLLTVDRHAELDFGATLSAVRDLDPEALASVRSVQSFPQDGPADSAETKPVTPEDFDTLVASVDERQLRAREEDVHPNDPYLIQFTSGTTAEPKGVVLSQDAVLQCAFHVGARTGFEPGDRIYSAMPFHHIGGTISTTLIPVTRGATLFVASWFDARRALRTMAAARCTGHMGWGATFMMLLDEREGTGLDFSSLRKGWAVAPPAVMDRIVTGLGMDQVVQPYGLSEAGICAAAWSSDPLKLRTRSSGSAIPGTEIQIRALDTGLVLPPGEVGEICVKGRGLMLGYLDDDATSAVIDADGWFRTGDLGMLDGNGDLHVVGRLKDMIKRGGENVAASEVEAVLLAHPQIRQAVVFGVPHDRWGEVPIAAVECDSLATVTTQDVIEACREQLANFKVPHAVWFVTEWPLTETGKIKKHELQEQWITGASAPQASA